MCGETERLWSGLVRAERERKKKKEADRSQTRHSGWYLRETGCIGHNQPYRAVPQPVPPDTTSACKLDRPRLRLMQTQVPPAPMAAYASFAPALMPPNPQQPAAAAQGRQQQHQTGGQLGAGHIAQAAVLHYPLGEFPAPGHYNHYHPDADQDDALVYSANPSWQLPSSVAQEEVLRPLTKPSVSSVCQQPAGQPSEPAPHRLTRPALLTDCPFSFLITYHVLSSLLLSHSFAHSRAPGNRRQPRTYTWLTVCATRNDEFRRCSSGRSAPCRATMPRRTNSPTPPTTQMVSSE